MKRHHNHNDERYLSIDQYANNSKTSHIHPKLKVILATTLMFFSIGMDSILISTIITLAMIYLTVIKGKVSFTYYIKLLIMPIIFLLLSTIAICFDLSFAEIGQYNIKVLNFYIITSDENIYKCILIICKSIGAVSSMYMMTLSIPVYEIIGVLKDFKIPSVIIELMNMIYKYIFILMNIQSKMSFSAKSRLGNRNLKSSYYSFSNIMTNLLIISFKEASMYYNAMEARCYNGEINFLEVKRNVNKKHIIYGVSFIIFILVIYIFVEIGGLYI